MFDAVPYSSLASLQDGLLSPVSLIVDPSQSVSQSGSQSLCSLSLTLTTCL